MINMKDEAARMGFEAALAYAPKLNAKDWMFMLRHSPTPERNAAPVTPEPSLAPLRKRFGERANNPKSKPRRAFDSAWRTTFRLLMGPLDIDSFLEVQKVQRVIVTELRGRLPRALRELRQDYAS